MSTPHHVKKFVVSVEHTKLFAFNAGKERGPVLEMGKKAVRMSKEQAEMVKGMLRTRGLMGVVQKAEGERSARLS